MPVNSAVRKAIVPAALALLSGVAMGQVTNTAASEPTTARAVPEIVAELRQKQQAFSKLFPDTVLLADAKKRGENGATGIKLLQGILSDIDALAAAQPAAAKSRPEARATYEALLLALGDAATAADVAAHRSG
ncbi:MAG: hypothetical protein QM754_09435 [Tepidisphaeraceae bacterium]